MSWKKVNLDRKGFLKNKMMRVVREKKRRMEIFSRWKSSKNTKMKAKIRPFKSEINCIKAPARLSCL